MSVAAFINRYTPTSLSTQDWQAVREFTITTITTAYSDTTPAGSVRNGAVAVAGIASYALHHGLSLDVREVFDDRFIEHYVYSLEVSERTKSSRRATLIRIGRALNDSWMGRPVTPAYSTPHATTPYTSDEIVTLNQWADTLRTDTFRYNAHMLLALALGAGLRSVEMDLLTTSEVSVDEQGVVLYPHGFRGAAPRAVPVDSRYERTIISALRSLKDKDFLFMPGRNTTGAQCVSDFVKRSGNPPGIDVTATRLRTTWIVELMRRNIPESAICDAAGVRDLQHYVKYREVALPATALDFRSAIRGAVSTSALFLPLRLISSD